MHNQRNENSDRLKKMMAPQREKPKRREEIRRSSRLGASSSRLVGTLVIAALVLGPNWTLPKVHSAPVISRLTPPSTLFSHNDSTPPIIARFLPGQRFDLQATIQADPGQTVTAAQFRVDGKLVPGTVSLAPATAAGLRTNSVTATLRAYALTKAGVHTLSVTATQSDGGAVSAQGNFEIVAISRQGRRAKNIILLIGDGMGIAHRTAARVMSGGVVMGKAKKPLAMDAFPFTGIVTTHSLNSIVTDSSPGAACYSTGNKANNNQHGVFPDDTTALFDNPRVESIAEFLHRTQGKSLGLVTTADVSDSTPAAFASHTQSRSAGTGIVDQYLDERAASGLTVLLGGGRKWFLPASSPGSARTNSTDYLLPAELAAGWGVSAGQIDPNRNLLADFQDAGFTCVADHTALNAIPSATRKLLGLFALSNMNVAKDKIDKRRHPERPGIVDDFGFPDQPMLDEMADKALQVLSQNPRGFVLMVEGASIDKQSHNMDTERWILDTIEFDRAVATCRRFAARNPDTLVVVTADHETGGANIIGSSMVSQAQLAARAATGGGVAQLRGNLPVKNVADTNRVVGTLEQAGFPRYEIAPDGYPVTTEVDFKMIIGYAANADRYEDWLTNPQPLQDSQQPLIGAAPLNRYPASPIDRDRTGGFLVTGQIPDAVATHTATDIPLSALGRGASLFSGVMDNTDVFFKIMQAVLGGGP